MSLIWIVNILSVFFLCVFFAGIVIPQILLIAFRRRLFDEPDERKIHQCVVPRLGGMAFKPVVFFSFVLLLAVNVSTGHDELLKEIGAEALPLAYAFCAIIMLYLVGIADDLIGVRYRAKFFIQIVCGIMLVAGGVELSDPEYWGNYSDYLRQKEEERKSQAAEYEQFIAERARLERAAEEKRKQARKIEKKAKGASKKKSTEGGGRLAHQKSMGSKAKKMHNAAKSLEHRIAALGKVEAPEDIRRIRFRQSKALELHNPYPIAGTEINKIFGDKVLFENVSFQIPLGAKVALTGSNGTGKTTLIQMILNHEDGISISPKAKIGYFAQNGYKYNSNQNVLEFMQEDCDYNVSEIRSVLASMGVKQNDIGKSLSVLSGGEIIKLLLAKMLMGRYNILLMDEPSNFLDIPSLEALEILMKEYAGTIVFITHDKRLLDNVADVIYEIKDKKLNLVR